MKNHEIHKTCKAKLGEKDAEVSSLKLEVAKLRQKLNKEVREKLQLRNLPILFTVRYFSD